MQFLSTVVLSALVGLIMAAPAPAPATIEARGSTTVFYCKKPNLKGDCYTAHISTGECVGVVGGYANQVASFLPSGTKCTIYSGGGCSGSSTSVGPQGAFHLDGDVGSYKCQNYRDAWGW